MRPDAPPGLYTVNWYVTSDDGDPCVRIVDLYREAVLSNSDKSDKSEDSDKYWDQVPVQWFTPATTLPVGESASS